MLSCGTSWKVNQPIAAGIIALGGFGFGSALAWTATALPKLQLENPVGYLTPTEKSWIASLLAIGALVATPVTGIYANSFGRKQSLQFFTTLGVLGWTFLGSANSPIYLYCGRVLTGLSVGGYTVLVPIFISEISSKENRGLLGSFFLVMFCIGKFYSNLMGIVYSASTASFMCTVPMILYAALLTAIPESPYLLAYQGKSKDAFRALQWYERQGCFMCFRGSSSSKPIDSSNISYQLEQIQSSQMTPQQQGKFSHSFIKTFFTSRELYIPTLTVFTEMLLAQFCGINVSTFFTLEIFELSRVRIIPSNQATLLIAVIQTVGCLPCSMFVDKYGRKVLLVTSFMTMSVSMFILSGFFYLREYTPEILDRFPALGLLPVFSLVIYNLSYSWGVGSVVWIVMAELLPKPISGQASAAASIIFWTSAFCVVSSFQMFKSSVPLFSWFLLFSIVSLIGAWFNAVLLPETKGLSSRQIGKIYRAKQNPERDNNIQGECDQ